MKTQRSFNVLSVGLLVSLIGSLLLNLYQLNERNRRSGEILLLQSSTVSIDAVSDDLAAYRQLHAKKDSLLFSRQSEHPTKSATHF